MLLIKIYISNNIDKHVSKNKLLSEIRQCCFSIFKLLKFPYFTNCTVKAMILKINENGEDANKLFVFFVR